MKKCLLFLMLFLIAGPCSPLRAGAPRHFPSEDFPLEKGNYWIYRGKTEFLVPKNEEEKQQGRASQPHSEVLTWKMEVLDTLERENLFAALIKGGPRDLSWYQPGKERGDYLILRVSHYLYYFYDGERALKVWAQLQASDPGRAPDADNLEGGESCSSIFPWRSTNPSGATSGLFAPNVTAGW